MDIFNIIKCLLIFELKTLYFSQSLSIKKLLFILLLQELLLTGDALIISKAKFMSRISLIIKNIMLHSVKQILGFIVW